MTAILFDLDGTLLDSLEDIADALNATLAAHGRPTHPLAAIQHFVGEGVELLVTRALAPAPFDPAVLQTWRGQYAERLTGKTRPYPGIEAMLAQLAQAGHVLAVLSNKPDAATQALVRHYFGAVPFAAVHGQQADVPRKPDPTAALQVAARLGVSACDWTFVGDTAIDMETARRAGMRAVGVTWGFRPREELVASGAEVVVGSAGELVGVLGGRSGG